MIKELVEKYQNVAFLCHSRKNYEQFIKNAHKEGIIFSKGGFIETEEEIIAGYRLADDNDNLIALIVTEEEEIQFYVRTYDYIVNPEWYGVKDWDKFKIVDYVKIIREEKLKKINQNLTISLY